MKQQELTAEQVKGMRGGKVNVELFKQMCAANLLPEPMIEYQFHKSRKWRFDFCWWGDGIALEVEGGIWTKGAHVRGKHFLSDMEKYNEAAILGWKVLRCTPEHIQTGAVFALLKRALG